MYAYIYIYTWHDVHACMLCTQVAMPAQKKMQKLQELTDAEFEELLRKPRKLQSHQVDKVHAKLVEIWEKDEKSFGDKHKELSWVQLNSFR